MPGGSLREALAATAQMYRELEITLMPLKRIVVLPVRVQAGMGRGCRLP